MAFNLFKKKKAAEPVIEPQKKYRLGLALGGGGVKGAAHCGVLQALHEFGIEPDIVSGTSAGSIVGALYTAGLTPVEICNLFILKEAKELIDIQLPTRGLFDHKPLLEYLKEILPVTRFEELKKPLRIVSCDLDAGKTVIFESGELAPRIMASCCIPVIFPPINIEGTNYVDGGVFMNLPALPLREECETLIGISVHASVAAEYKNNLAGVAMRSFYLMFISNTLDDARMCDIHIDVNTEEFSSYDLSNIELLFERGYQTAVTALESRGYVRQLPVEEILFTSHTKPTETVSTTTKLKNAVAKKQAELKAKATSLTERIHPTEPTKNESVTNTPTADTPIENEPSSNESAVPQN